MCVLSNSLFDKTIEFLPRLLSEASAELSESAASSSTVNTEVFSLVEREGRRLSESEAKRTKTATTSVCRVLEELTQTTDDAFMLVDLDKVRDQMRRWKSKLPRIQPFYAVKCNPDDNVISTIQSMGGNADCASKAEIAQALRLGLSADRIIFSNPCKQVSHIRFARDNGISLTVFDNVDELHKLKRVFPEVSLLLRIWTDDSNIKSTGALSSKFGAKNDSWGYVLDEAKRLQLNVVGVHFHVGSGHSCQGSYAAALESSRMLFDLAEKKKMHFTILNIGGGYPGALIGEESTGQQQISFDAIADEINQSLDILFPEERPVTIYAEPGRYFATGCCTLCAQVFSRRVPVPTSKENKVIYYINEGYYGALNCIVNDDHSVQPKYLKKHFEHQATIPCTVYGPTCDGIDIILDSYPMPLLQVGDWIYFTEVGAYTTAAACNFNGFEKVHFHYINK